MKNYHYTQGIFIVVFFSIYAHGMQNDFRHLEDKMVKEIVEFSGQFSDNELLALKYKNSVCIEKSKNNQEQIECVNRFINYSVVICSGKVFGGIDFEHFFSNSNVITLSCYGMAACACRAVNKACSTLDNWCRWYQNSAQESIDLIDSMTEVFNEIKEYEKGVNVNQKEVIENILSLRQGVFRDALVEIQDKVAKKMLNIGVNRPSDLHAFFLLIKVLKSPTTNKWKEMKDVNNFTLLSKYEIAEAVIDLIKTMR